METRLISYSDKFIPSLNFILSLQIFDYEIAV